jgi:hypothetical protein
LRPEWVFVKIHTHGTQERDMDTLLGDAATHAPSSGAQLQRWQALRAALRHGREVYNIIKAAEAGLTGNPHDYRDYELPPPGVRVVVEAQTA